MSGAQSATTAEAARRRSAASKKGAATRRWRLSEHEAMKAMSCEERVDAIAGREIQLMEIAARQRALVEMGRGITV